MGFLSGINVSLAKGNLRCFDVFHTHTSTCRTGMATTRAWLPLYKARAKLAMCSIGIESRRLWLKLPRLTFKRPL